MKSDFETTDRPFRAVATALALAVLSISELLVQLGGIEEGKLFGRGAFLFLCVFLASGFKLREWVLSGLCIALAFGLFSIRNGTEDILFALDRAAFFAAFIYLVTLLKEAAQRSNSVLLLGQYVTRQPAGRRYYSLAGGSHLLGVLLNFGAISLLTPLILRGARAASDDPDVIAKADQQQISAMIRGFAWMIMWSPTALTQAVLFASFPSIDLVIVITLGICASFVMALVGRVEDRWRWRGRRLAGFVTSMDFPKRAALRFGIICIMIIGLTFSTVIWFDVSAALGLMLVAPLFMMVWIFEQEFDCGVASALRKSVTEIGNIFTRSSRTLGLNAFTLGVAGFIGEAAARLLPVSSYAHALGINAMPDWLFLIVLPVIITLGGQIALSPILIVVFLSAIINQLPVLPADPNLIVFSLGAGWAMSMAASPNASATLLISGITGVAPTTLTWRWNGVYALMCYSVFCVAFVVLAQVFPR